MTSTPRNPSPTASIRRGPIGRPKKTAANTSTQIGAVKSAAPTWAIGIIGSDPK